MPFFVDYGQSRPTEYPYDVTVTRRENEGFGFVIISSAKAKKTCNLSKKTIWITFSVLGFILVQSLILGFVFMTYTTLNQERIKVSELEARLAKMSNYEALLQYNEDADKKLYEVKAMAEG